MTTSAFDQSVTDEIKRRFGETRACDCNDGTRHKPGCIYKTVLRLELRNLLQAAEIYDEQAARHAGEAAKCAELARAAREQAQKLKKLAGL